MMLTVMAGPSWAQTAEIRPLLDRIDRLERDIETLSRNVYRGGASGQSTAAVAQPATAPALSATEATGPAAARLNVRITDLESEVRAMTGSIEKLSFDIAEVRRLMEKALSDIEFRMGALEHGRGGQGQPGTPYVAKAPGPASVEKALPSAAPGTLGTIPAKALGGQAKTEENQAQAGSTAIMAGTPSAAVTQAPAPATVVALPKGTPQEQYDFARKLLIQGEFDQAEAALQAFISSNGDDPLTGNARYWLGETFYVRGNFRRAAEVFLEGYQKDPAGSKAADSLLKLGMSLSKLEKKPESCATFGKLLKDFPKASSNVRVVAERESKRLDCK
ncbi:MAG: tol-pal system protein YbgF [Rhodospirillales bacterium]|nr:tol-pal system protein YbgF [Rhodospirillales bacterium]